MYFTFIKRITIVVIQIMMDFIILKDRQVLKRIPVIEGSPNYLQKCRMGKTVGLNAQQAKRGPTLDNLDRTSQIRFRRHYLLMNGRGET